MMLVREGLQMGAWQWALVNSTPRRASRSIFGVWVSGQAAHPVVQVVYRNE